MCMRTKDSRYLCVGYDEDQQFETRPCLLWQSDFMLRLLQGICSFYEVWSLQRKCRTQTRNKAKVGGKKVSVDATISKMRVAASLYGDHHLLFRSCPVASLRAAHAELTKALCCCLLHLCREFCHRSYTVPRACISFLRPCLLMLFCCEKFTVWVRVSCSAALVGKDLGHTMVRGSKLQGLGQETCLQSCRPLS